MKKALQILCVIHPILFGVALYILVFAVLFPVSYAETETRVIQLDAFENRAVQILDRAETDNRSSLFFLVEDESKELYVAVAEKSPLFPSYRLLHPMSFSGVERFDSTDFSRSYTLLCADGMLTVSASPHFYKGWFTVSFSLLPALLSSISRFRKYRHKR